MEDQPERQIGVGGQSPTGASRARHARDEWILEQANERFLDDWAYLTGRMPYRSKYSDLARHSIETPQIEGFVQDFVEAGQVEDGGGFVLIGYVRSDRAQLELRGRTLSFPIRFKTLRFVCDSVFWFSDGDLEHCVARLEDALRSGLADRIHLHYLRPTSPSDFQSLCIGLERRGLRLQHHRTHRLYRCDVGPGSELPSLRVSSKARRNRRRERSALERELGKVETRVFESADQADAFFAACTEIARHTRHVAEGVAVFDDTPRNRSVFELEAGSGRLRAYVLYAGETPIAYSFGAVFGDTHCGEFTAFDHRYSKYGPGKLLMLDILDELHTADVRWADLGHGDFDYKAKFATEEVALPDVYVYGDGIRSRGIGRLDQLQLGLRSLAHRLRARLERRAA